MMVYETKPTHLSYRSSGWRHFSDLGFEQHHDDLVHRKVEETTSGVRHEGAVACTDNAVPCRSVHFIKLLYLNRKNWDVIFIIVHLEEGIRWRVADPSYRLP